jgi:hypothetical protein
MWDNPGEIAKASHGVNISAPTTDIEARRGNPGEIEKPHLTG